MKRFQKPPAFLPLYLTCLTCFTLFVLLDTFVIPRAYATVPNSTAQEQPNSGTSAETSATDSGTSIETSSSTTTQNGSTVVTAASYQDSNIIITLTEYRENNTNIYVADVVLQSAQYLKTALAGNTYGRNVTQKTSAIAAASNAILAINGDYYGAHNSGYVIRNGVLYRDSSSNSTQEDLVIYEDGSFAIIQEGSVSASELLAQGAQQVLSFGPALVTDGSVVVSRNEEVDQAKTSNPRTAIGIIDHLHYVLVVSDGRTEESEGLSIYQLAEFLQGLGVKTAYNLDGGGSSTLYFNGVVVNNPTTDGNTIKERSVSDIVCIGY